VVNLVRRECAEMEFGAQQIGLNVPVALTEALSNAILRGNRQDPAKHVYVHVRIDRHSLIIEVKDEGSGFDIGQCMQDPTTPDRLESEDGRGLFLMQQLMDSVEQVSMHEGNVVRLTLRRAS